MCFECSDPNIPPNRGFHQKVNNGCIGLEGCVTETTEAVGHNSFIDAVQVPAWNWEESCLIQS